MQIRYAWALWVLLWLPPGSGHAADAPAQPAAKALAEFVVPPGFGVDANYRETYRLVTRPYVSGMHWNHFIRVFVHHGVDTYLHNSEEFQEHFGSSDDWLEDADPQYRSYPAGTVLIKENFWEFNEKPGPAHSLTIMLKMAPGYDAEHGDWQYLELDRRGNLRLQGNARQQDVSLRCAQCHINAKERDYVFSIDTSSAGE